MRRIIPKSGKGRRSRIGRLSFTSSEGISLLIPIHLTGKRETNDEEEKDFFDVEESQNRNSWNNQNTNRSRNPNHTMDCVFYVISLFYTGACRVNETVFYILLNLPCFCLFSMTRSSLGIENYEFAMNSKPFDSKATAKRKSFHSLLFLSDGIRSQRYFCSFDRLFNFG